MGLLGFGLILVPLFNEAAQNELRVNADAHVNFFSFGLAYPLSENDHNQIKSFVQATASDPNIGTFEVYDKHGTLLAQRRNMDLVTQINHAVVRDFTVKYHEVPVGRIKMVFNSNSFIRQIRIFSYVIVSIALLVLLFSAIVLRMYVIKRIIYPLRELISSSLSVSKGEFKHLDFSSNLPREWIQVKESFDYMSDELKYYSEKLESLVEKRTQERDQDRMKAIGAARLAAVGEMSAGIAHEINNPLTIINLQGQILRKMMEEDHSLNEKKINCIELVFKMSHRITTIIKSLKNFSREGEWDPVEICSLNKIINETQDFCAARMSGKGISFLVSTSSDNDLKFLGRPVQIGQVMLNLINNSIDAIQDSDDKWVRIESFKIDKILKIKVTDSGLGIPVDIRKKILQPFFTTKEVGKGTGLGLSLSKGIIEQHSGQFYYDESSTNTTFIIELPLFG